MKKLLTCFFVLQIVAPAAFAADGAISRALPGATAAKTETSATVSARGNSSSGTATRTAVASRVVSTQNQNSSDNATVSARGTATAVRTSVSRGTATTNSTTSARTGLDAATHTVGRNARVSEASINNKPAVRRAGVTLRPSTAEVGGRARISGTDIQTGSNIGGEARSLQSRAAANKTPTKESIAEAKEILEQTADLNKSCQDQYNECMDQFCAVIDSNQKRCSCSANLSRYTKVEAAVKDANSQLNDVAQRIRYVGLSADEISAIMTATEAEEALSGQRDTTETRSMLDDIAALIKDPTSSTAGTDNYSSLDLNLDFSSDSSDLFNLDFLNNSSSSMANLRGTDLYNAAKKRCNTVLTQCKNAGATQQQITANYDLAIDRDCIAYEQGLNKMNETLVSNVRSATLMLQKARMAVLQNKNQYDAKGCIAALDTCMRDDMVCGDDYLKCLDPTKKYIDENGKVVLGQNINNITAFMENYNNAAVDSGFLEASLKTPINEGSCKTSTNGADGNVDFSKGGNNGACVVRYLMQKIGTGQKSTDGGLCRAVLDKCQRYTYTSDGKYKSDNDIVKNYIQRAMVNIQAGQQKAISDYASSCMLDLATCYNQQVTQVNTWTTSASVSSVRNVMSGACRNVALTCAYAVFAKDETSCPTSSNKEATCIENISEMFYQSLLCPTNSTYTSVSKTTAKSCPLLEPSLREDAEKVNSGIAKVTAANKGMAVNTGYLQSITGVQDILYERFGNISCVTAANKAYVNEHCFCNTGYEVWGSQCLLECDNGGLGRDEYGACKKGGTASSGSAAGGMSITTPEPTNTPTPPSSPSSCAGATCDILNAKTAKLDSDCICKVEQCIAGYAPNSNKTACVVTGSIADEYTSENGFIYYSNGATLGTLDDCKERANNLKPYGNMTIEEWIAYPANKTNGKIYVPSQCAVRLKDEHGICYIGRFDWYNHPKDSNGISTIEFTSVNGSFAIGCSDMPGEQDHAFQHDDYFSITSRGVSLPWGWDSFFIYMNPDGNRFSTEPINILLAEMQRTNPDKIFKGISAEFFNGVEQIVNENGVATGVPPHPMNQYHMDWEDRN